MDEDENDKHTFSVVNGAKEDFVFQGADLVTKRKLDYEGLQGQPIVVKVEAKDRYNKTVAKEFKVAVVDVNDAPHAAGLNPAKLKEDAPTGRETPIGVLSAADQDPVDKAHTFAVVSPLQGFAVKAAGWGGQGAAKKFMLVYTGEGTALDYESAEKVPVVVRVTDGRGASGDITLDVALVDANDATTFTSTALEAREDVRVGEKIAVLPIHDDDVLVGKDWLKGRQPENLAVTLASTADSASFKVKGLDLYLAKALNFEAKATYELAVTVSDTVTPARNVSATLTITVLDVAEAPVLVTLSHATVKEMSANSGTRKGDAVGGLAVYDEDLSTATLAITTTSGVFGVEGQGPDHNCTVVTGPLKGSTKLAKGRKCVQHSRAVMSA